MNSYRVLRNTAATMIAASAMVGSAGIGQAKEIMQPARKGLAKMIVHQGTWFTQAQPRVIRFASRTTKSRNKAIAFRLVSRRLWSHNQFRCLNSLWTRESNWNHQAYNASSGAYGIPQALPGSKMSGSGRDWRLNPVTQISWGLGYIKSRYGSPCGAWGHFQSSNWY